VDELVPHDTPRNLNMLPGPVFNVELLTTARRARYYAVRALYASILLFVLYQTYSSYFWWRGGVTGTYSIRQMSDFAKGMFASIAYVQLFAILVLTPTLVAGVIADEKQRKTLHYLLASRLTSAEIVLGKLAARLLHVGVFLAIALPIVSLIGLFGGVDPLLVAITYVATFSTAFLLAGISIWISTTARRARDAIVAVYMIEFSWLVIPIMLEGLRWSWPVAYSVIHPVNEVFLISNPFWTVLESAGRAGSVPAAIDRVLKMVGLQVGVGIVCIFLAVCRLRPLFRNQSGESKRKSKLARFKHWRPFPRPACGDDPMLWKERYVVRSGGLVRLLVRVLAILGLLFLGYWFLYYAEPAFQECWAYGYGSTGANSARNDFNGAIVRAAGTIIYVIWILAIASAAAAGVTSEKEEDTWTSLTTTTLSGTEILAAKMIGAAWAPRLLLYTMLFLWTVGLLCGALHPIGALCLIVELALFTWFAAALGTYISLKSKNTTRATALTMLILMAINVGYMMCCVPVRADTPLIAAPCTPALIAFSGFTYDELWGILGWRNDYYSQRSGEYIAAGIAGTFTYGLAALLLTAKAFHDFDKVVDRPIYIKWDRGKPVKLGHRSEDWEA
jgi:ABC-type transport system involved in multi-copper enzyme maturation permease subunit